MIGPETGVYLPWLIEELEALPFTREGHYIEMATTQSNKMLLKWPSIQNAANEISSLRKLPIVYVMVNRLLAGTETPVHQDFLMSTPLQPYKYPLIERWHLPVITNPLCMWHERTSGISLHMERGRWHGPVPYWNHHWVSNKGSADRLHLIVDLDCEEPQGAYEK